MDPVFTDPQHMETQGTSMGEWEKALGKSLDPVSNQEKQKTGSEEMSLGVWKQIKAEMGQNIQNN